MKDVKNQTSVNYAPSTTYKVAKYAGATTAFLVSSTFAYANTSVDFATMLQPIVTMIMGVVAVVASIGMAVITVYATGKVFKWARAAF